MTIEVRQISKRFGRFTALYDVSLTLDTGELVAFLGPSGSGKTTLLRLLAGLEGPDRGHILLDGADIASIRARERQVGFVFQHYALFQHLTVFENVAFGLRVRPRKTRPAGSAIRDRINHLLRLVQLESLGQRYPAQLSGGQQQRVAVARALAIEPRLLLLDEPFGALDVRVRQELRRWLRELQAALRITTVLVTHDQEEALEVADRVAVLHNGHIAQVGTPEALYAQPATPFVAEFLGDVNRVTGQITGEHFHIGPWAAALPGVSAATGDAVGYVRPHDLLVQRDAAALGLPTVVQRVQNIGPVVRVELTRQDTGEPLNAQLSPEAYHALALREGDCAYVTPRNVRVFVDERPVELLTSDRGLAEPAYA